jgi:phosphoserine phosphatase RsbU/P
MMPCTQCGKNNRDGSRYCTCCGRPLASSPGRVGRLLLLSKAETREYQLAGAERSIGRGPNCDVVVRDDEMSVEHARISFAEECYWVEDLQSSNGTFVNGRRIQGRTALQSDDLLRLGGTLFKFKN